MIRWLLPARVTVIMAGMAAIVAVGMHVLAAVLVAFGWPLSGKAQSLANTFSAMPIWALLSGSMSRVAEKIDQFWGE